MSCDHQLVSSSLDDYLGGRLAEAQRLAYEQVLASCASCREVHEQALRLEEMASQWQERKPPAWHRNAWVARPVRQHGSWLGWIALTASACSLLLVVLRFEISVDDGLHIGFGGRLSEQRLEAQMAEFRAATIAGLGDELAGIVREQELANRLQLAEWAEGNRQERRRDIEFLMSTWEAQRFADRQRTEERLSYLARNQIESDQYLNELIENVGYTPRGAL